jgi:tripartite motif-containing protein 71
LLSTNAFKKRESPPRRPYRLFKKLTGFRLVTVILIVSSLIIAGAQTTNTVNGTRSGEYQFQTPFGIAIDSSDNVYVADSGSNTILKFSSSGSFIKQWGSDKIDDFGGFAVRDENVYVHDTGGTYRLKVFTTSGDFVMQAHCWRQGDQGFNSQSEGIAVDSSGNIYMVDTLNDYIQKFNSAGNFIRAWGHPATIDDQFDPPDGVVIAPSALTIDDQNNLYVTDTLYPSIQKFSSSGSFKDKWEGEFRYTHGLAVDDSGNIYSTNYVSNCVLKLDKSGTIITQWGTKGSASGQFDSPSGIAVDSLGNVYVADIGNLRIQKFTSSGAFLTEWGSILVPATPSVTPSPTVEPSANPPTPSPSVPELPTWTVLPLAVAVAVSALVYLERRRPDRP